MPWTAQQVKLFRAAAHNPQIAKEHGLSMQKADQMSKEGIKDKPQKLAKALRSRA